MHIGLQRDKRTSFYYPHLQPPRCKKTDVVAMDILDLTLRLSARLGVRLRPRTTPEEIHKALFLRFLAGCSMHIPVTIYPRRCCLRPSLIHTIMMGLSYSRLLRLLL